MERLFRPSNPKDSSLRRLAGHRLSRAGSRLFSTSDNLRYLRILVLPHIRVARPTAWFGQEPDNVHFLSKSIPVVMRPFALRAADTGQITRVDIEAGATASRGHRQAGQRVRIAMSSSALCCIVVLYWLSSSSQRANWSCWVSKAQQPYQTMGVRSHNELPAKQVVAYIRVERTTANSLFRVVQYLP